MEKEMKQTIINITFFALLVALVFFNLLMGVVSSCRNKMRAKNTTYLLCGLANFGDKNEANARAKMVCYLVENGYLSFDNLPKR